MQWCAWQNGVWDDSDIVSWNSAGGRCIGYEERNSMLANDPELEEVFITLSNDGNVTGGVQQGHVRYVCKQQQGSPSAGRCLHWLATGAG